MIVVAQLAALAAAAVHLLAFVWETILFRRPSIHRDVFRIPTEDVRPVRMWAFNVGFYNLFLGSGALAGVILWWTGHEAPGRTLVVYTCTFMFLAGIALFASDRMAMSRPRGAGVVGVALSERAVAGRARGAGAGVEAARPTIWCSRPRSARSGTPDSWHV